MRPVALSHDIQADKHDGISINHGYVDTKSSSLEGTGR